MNLISRKICLLIGVLFLGAGFSSCIYEYPEEAQKNPGDGKAIITFSISPVNQTRSTNRTVIEKIKTLRVVMLNENTSPVIEANDLISFSGMTTNADGSVTSDVASEFEYTYARVSTMGIKKFYLIGNEESVSTIKVADTSLLPSDLQSKSSLTLTDVLDYYTADGGKSAEEFETLMNSIYFEPSYDTESGEVFLAYSSYYDLNTADYSPDEQGNMIINTTMYLVPVATKFDINVVSQRRNNVQITDVQVRNINANNYLMAQVDETDATKQLNNQDMYWIDWLAECSRLSQSAQDNIQFNDIWGWIHNYKMPLGDTDLAMRSFLTMSGGSSLGEVPAMQDKDNPPVLAIGPFYLPESNNTTVPDSGSAVAEGDETDVPPIVGPGDFPTPTVSQYYEIQFVGHDQVTMNHESYTGFMAMPYVKALFRATHVIVTLVMTDTGVEIYAEIGPWQTAHFKGYLEMEDEDD